MAIGDYIWPFRKDLSKIPCAREAGVNALLGGPVLGAGTIVATGKTRYAFKTATYAGFVIFWITFITCRYQYDRTKRLSNEFLEAVREGRVD